MALERWQHRGWHYLLLLCAGSLLCLVNLGGASLWDLDEGRNATCALEMLANDNYVVPYFNGQLRTDKPPLLYWLQIFAYRVFGINEFAARLPSALAALATMLLAYELGRAMFGKATGLLAALMAGSTPLLCGAARFANPDALLHCCVVLTMTVFWIGQGRPSRGWYALLGVATGLAVLAKGPVGLVLPGGIIFLYCWWTSRLGLFWNRHLTGAVLTFGLVALPWYIWVASETKMAFLKGFFLNHNVNRFLSPMENHGGSPLYYLAVLILGTTPWSIFLALALWYGFWSLRAQPSGKWASTWQTAAEPGRRDAYRFLAVWLGAFVAFFSLAATKLPNYVLPTLVPLSLLMGRFLVRWCRGQVQPPPWTLAVSLGFLGLVGVGTGVGLMVAGGAWPVPMLQGRTIDGLANRAILGIVPVLAALTGWWLMRRGRRLSFVAALVVAAVAFLAPLASWASAALNRVKPCRPLVEQAQALQLHREIRIGCWQVEHLPSLNFYVQREVEHLRQLEQVPLFLRSHFPVFVFLPADQWEQVEDQAPAGCRELGRHRDLYRNRDVVVIGNR